MRDLCFIIFLNYLCYNLLFYFPSSFLSYSIPGPFYMGFAFSAWIKRKKIPSVWVLYFCDLNKILTVIYMSILFFSVKRSVRILLDSFLAMPFLLLHRVLKMCLDLPFILYKFMRYLCNFVTYIDCVVVKSGLLGYSTLK